MSPCKLVLGLNHKLTLVVSLDLETILVDSVIGARFFTLISVLIAAIALVKTLTSTSTTAAGLFKVFRSLSDVVEECVRAKVLSGVLKDLFITTIDWLQGIGSLTTSRIVSSAARRSGVIALKLSVLEGALFGRFELELFLVLEATTAPTITAASSWAIIETTSTPRESTSTSTEPITTSSTNTKHSVTVQRSSVIVLVVNFVREARPVLVSLNITSSLISTGTTGFIVELDRTVLEALGNVTVSKLW